MKEQLQSHIERQRTQRQRPMSCHPAFTPTATTEHVYHTRRSDQRDNRYR